LISELHDLWEGVRLDLNLDTADAPETDARIYNYCILLRGFTMQGPKPLHNSVVTDGLTWDRPRSLSPLLSTK
jgi:hypothetical protein